MPRCALESHGHCRQADRGGRRFRGFGPVFEHGPPSGTAVAPLRACSQVKSIASVPLDCTMGCCQSDDASAEESIPVKGTVPPKNYGSTATAAGASADVAAVAVGDVHVDALANIAAAAASGDAGGSSAAAQSEGDNDASARPLSLEIRAEKAKEREERLKELLGAGL